MSDACLPHTAPASLGTRVREAFQLDWTYRFLNHGSFGAVPRIVEEAACQWRQRLEARPIAMVGREMAGLLGEVRGRIGGYLGCAPERIGLVTNATSGVGSVLASIQWAPGDRILLTNHGYNAVRQAVHRASERWGVECSITDIPLSIGGDGDVADAIIRAIDPRTRLVIVDHVTSPTALVFPVAAIAAECRRRGILCLVDGAHAPGMLPLQIDAIDADWYTGNLHKWVCAPKGSGVLVASERTSVWTHPETTSHFHGSGFVDEFAWQGTRDFASWLAIPAAIDFVEGVVPGGAMSHNRALALWASARMADAFGSEVIGPGDGSMTGSMASIPLPRVLEDRWPSAQEFQARLYDQHRIEVPIIEFGGRWHVRISAQVYNLAEDYLALEAAVLAEAS
ncbi:MAG: aminotransferase class V-fold PLP-dependent enzyme [Phycisphaerales bacterium]|nr:aminotransferase class V-fold PLP-dependent enzyme [Phycisphaerales bacterium]